MHEEGGAQVLQQLLTFEWSSRLDAKDALQSPFFKGRRARAGEPMCVACGVGCDVSKPPPPFVPAPWVPLWSEEHAAWYFWRTGRNGCYCSTFDVPPCVHPLWEVCWCEEEQRFWFQHSQTGQGMFEIPRERAPVSAVWREIPESSVSAASSVDDLSLIHI